MGHYDCERCGRYALYCTCKLFKLSEEADKAHKASIVALDEAKSLTRKFMRKEINHLDLSDLREEYNRQREIYDTLYKEELAKHVF